MPLLLPAVAGEAASRLGIVSPIAAARQGGDRLARRRRKREAASCSRARTARPAALGRSPEGAGARQAPERGDQGQPHLHVVPGAVSFPGDWDPLARVFDAWGFDRCSWGTDWTRAFAVVHYEQAVEPFLKTDRPSDTERAMLIGGACAKAYGWSPKEG